jgi:hypothetical protein
MSGPDTAELTLHIDGPAAEGHAVPAAVLIQILENFQRAIELIGMHVEGKGIRDRARVPAAISRKFRLVCRLPQEGSYALPISIGDPSADLLAAQQIKEAWTLLNDTLRSVYERKVEAVRDHLPDTAFRTRVLEAIKGMAPRPGAGWTLQLLGRGGNTLAELDESTAQFVQEEILSPQPKEALETVTGQLRSIDFGARKLTLIHPITNRVLDCYYDETIEDLLYENRRQMIQVTGRVLLDDAGQPKEIMAVSDIRDLDLSPFELDRVQTEAVQLRTRAKLILEPALDETCQFMCLEDDGIGIMVYGQTRESLREELHSQIAMLWSEYATVEDDNLTEDAIALKQTLLKTFEDIKDAA